MSPTRPPHACPGCGASTTAPRCAACESKRQARHDAQRPSFSQRGYPKWWPALRRRVLDAEPLCRACSTEGHPVAATDVDHIVPIEQGGTHAVANLQPLCKSCHSAKTMRELNAARAVRR